MSAAGDSSGRRRSDETGVRPPIRFDPHDPGFVEEGVPFDVLARIRRECPVYRTPSGAWYLSRYEDIEAALVDVDTFRAELGPITGIPAGCASIPEDQHFLSEIPEPRHGRVRRLYNSIFAWHRVRQLEPILEAECHRLLDALFAKGGGDLHGEYALGIPAFAMAHIMGLGDEAVALFMRWSSDGTMMTRPATPGVPPEGPASHVYFRARIAEQRALPAPTNHVFEALLGAEIEGRRLTDMEIATQLHFMVQAGVHTTRSFLAHLMNRLVQFPELYARLDAERDLIPSFLEESLRHDAPVQRTTRVATRDIEVGGVLIRKGETVEMGIGSGNREDSIYESPAEFRLDRPDPRRHLAFGAGSHVCPGAMLARLEGGTAVRVLLDRARILERVEGAVYPPLPGSLGHQPIPARLRAR
jgi:cytochrome P450